jgi:hypothetical protein
MEAICSSETSILTRVAWCHIPEGGIIQFDVISEVLMVVGCSTVCSGALEWHIQDESAMFMCAILFFCHRETEEAAPINESKNKSVLKKAFSTSSIPNKVESSSSIAAEDIDKDDKGDPFLLPEYVNDIYAYLRELEVRKLFRIQKEKNKFRGP